MHPVLAPASVQRILVRVLSIGWGCHVEVTSLMEVESLPLQEASVAPSQSKMQEAPTALGNSHNTKSLIGLDTLDPKHQRKFTAFYVCLLILFYSNYLMSNAIDFFHLYCTRSSQELEEDVANSSRILPRTSSSTALSELLEGLRKKRAGWDKSSEVDEGSTVSVPIYQPTAASSLRRRTLAHSPETDDGLADAGHPGILKVPSSLLPHASSLRSLSESTPTASSATSTMSKVNRFGSSVLSSMQTSNLLIPEEWEGDTAVKTLSALGTQHPIRHRLFKGLTAEGDGEDLLGSEPLVFQNRQLLEKSKTDKERVGSNLGDINSVIAPAIRRSQSISSLTSSSSRGGQRRALSVHFGELPRSRALCKDSDSDSSDSEGSQQQIGPQEKRLEAEGSEGDISSVMKKYLKKSEVD